jgi:hypothetical protein
VRGGAKIAEAIADALVAPEVGRGRSDVFAGHGD